MAFSVYNDIVNLPALGAVPGDEAFVRENSTFYTFEDLSLQTTYGYEFPGTSSYLSLPTVMDAFPNTSDHFTIDFWTYSAQSIKNPIFTAETTTFNYSFQDDLNSTLDIIGAPKSLYISPYDSDLTSEYFNGSTDRIRSYDVQSTLSTLNQPFQIEYSSRASNSPFTIFSSYKTDKAESILEINSSNIVVNGVTLSGAISYGSNTWQHNRLVYDGFDYSFYKNGDLIPLTRPNSTLLDSAQPVLFSQLNVFKDSGFECRVVFPSSPSNGVLFEIGGNERRMRVELINNGNTLFFTAGPTTLGLSVSITDFPKDDQIHTVVWDVQMNPARIRLWIDGVLKGQSLKTVPIPDNIWATSDGLTNLPNVSSFLNYNWSYLVNLDGGKRYEAGPPGSISRYTPLGYSINKNGTNIYYFEIESLQNGDNRMFFNIVNPSRFFNWGWFSHWYAPSNDVSSAINLWWFYLRTGDRFSIFINERNNTCYFFHNKNTYYGSINYSRLSVNTNLTYMLESYYYWGRFRVNHAREYWKYDPTEFLSSPYLNLGADGGYGSNYVNGVKSSPWPADLISDLRTYPQCISELTTGSFNIGNRYIPSTNSNTNGYRGYLKDFHFSTDSALQFNEDSDLTDSDFLNGTIKKLSIPEKSLSPTPNSKFLLKSNSSGGVILSYDTDGTLRVNGKSYMVDSQHPPFSWKHKTISYDGNYIKVFDNGVLEFKEEIPITIPLSDTTLNIGRGTTLDFNTASNVNYFMKGNLSDFRIRDVSLTDSDFSLPIEPYSTDSAILVTGNKSAVENNATITNINNVRSTEFSPYSSSTRAWFKTGILTDKVKNVNFTGNSFLFDLLDSSITLDNVSPSVFVEFNKKDASNTDLLWKAEYLQPDPPFISVKQKENGFLIEPIYQNDSYYSRNAIISFTGYRSDSSIPFVRTAEFDPIVSDLKINFNYQDYALSLIDRSNTYLLPYFDIYQKDSDIDSDFMGVHPLPYQTYSMIPIQMIDSLGELP